MLNDLYERGLGQVLQIVTNGLSDIKDACLKVYPKANHYRVHIQRTIENLGRFKSRKEIIDSVKPLFGSKTIKEKLLEFDKLKKRLVQSIQR